MNAQEFRGRSGLYSALHHSAALSSAGPGPTVGRLASQNQNKLSSLVASAGTMCPQHPYA